MSQVPVEQRKAVFAAHISRLVAQGRIIESQGEGNAVLLRRNRLVTRREIASIDESGEFALQQLPLGQEQWLRLIVMAVVAALIILALIVSLFD